MDGYAGRLDAAKAALLDNDPGRCTQEIEAFENLCRHAPPQGAERDLCDMKLKNLSFLAEAAIEGITAAYGELCEAVSAAGHLTVYGSGGTKEMRATRRGLTRRY